jgi:hypothetical protein
MSGRPCASASASASSAPEGKEEPLKYTPGGGFLQDGSVVYRAFSVPHNSHSVSLGGPDEFLVDGFRLPLEASKVKRVAASWRWRDQGWGNRKGRLYLQLVNSKGTVAMSKHIHEGVAPHEESGMLLEWPMPSDPAAAALGPLIEAIAPGDELLLRMHVGEGGGHSLTVRDFEMLLFCGSGWARRAQLLAWRRAVAMME